MSLHRGSSGGALGDGSSYYNSPMTQINTAYSQMGYPELATSSVPPPPTTTTTASTISGSYMPTSDDSQHHHYLYAASAAANAAAHLGHNTPASSPQSATAPALVGYGTLPQPQAPAPQHHHPHPHQHHPHQHQHHQHHHHQHQPSHPHPHSHPHSHPHPHHQAQAQAPAGPATSWMAAVPGSANPWNEWTNAMVDPAAQDRYSANALLTLGGGQRGPGDAGAGEMGVGGHSGVSAGQSGQWPMLLFHPNVSGA